MGLMDAKEYDPRPRQRLIRLISVAVVLVIVRLWRGLFFVTSRKKMWWTDCLQPSKPKISKKPTASTTAILTGNSILTATTVTRSNNLSSSGDRRATTAPSPPTPSSALLSQKEKDSK